MENAEHPFRAYRIESLRSYLLLMVRNDIRLLWVGLEEGKDMGS